MITSDSVEKACLEVEAYTEDRMDAEFDQFFRQQPDICKFVTQMTLQSSRQLHELALFLSFMIFKAAHLEAPGAWITVDADRIDTAYRENEAWLDRISQINESSTAEVANAVISEAEPHLIHYVISELNQPLETGDILEDDQKGEVFFVLKTVISSLARRPSGPEAQS
jgi:hypothetical protein